MEASRLRQPRFITTYLVLGYTTGRSKNNPQSLGIDEINLGSRIKPSCEPAPDLKYPPRSSQVWGLRFGVVGSFTFQHHPPLGYDSFLVSNVYTVDSHILAHPFVVPCNRQPNVLAVTNFRRKEHVLSLRPKGCHTGGLKSSLLVCSFFRPCHAQVSCVDTLPSMIICRFSQLYMLSCNLGSPSRQQPEAPSAYRYSIPMCTELTKSA